MAHKSSPPRPSVMSSPPAAHTSTYTTRGSSQQGGYNGDKKGAGSTPNQNNSGTTAKCDALRAVQRHSLLCNWCLSCSEEVAAADNRRGGSGGCMCALTDRHQREGETHCVQNPTATTAAAKMLTGKAGWRLPHYPPATCHDLARCSTTNDTHCEASNNNTSEPQNILGHYTITPLYHSMHTHIQSPPTPVTVSA